MFKVIKIFSLLLFLFFQISTSIPVMAQTSEGRLSQTHSFAAASEFTADVVNVYFFWGEGCPYCEMQKPFLEELANRYPEVAIKSYEVYNNLDNRSIFFEMSAVAGFDPQGVPTTFIGTRHWVGFSDQIAQEMEAKVVSCIQSPCPDPGQGIPGTGVEPQDPEPTEEPVIETPVAPVNQDVVNVYFFWGEGCPYCEMQKPFLEELANRYPEVAIKSYEVWQNHDNRFIFFEMASKAGFEPQAVPTTFIGDRHWTGFSDPISREMEAKVVSCIQSPCPDPGQGIPGTGVEPLDPEPTEEPAIATPTAPVIKPPGDKEPNIISIPFIGDINLDAQSLAFSTAIIAFVDGFNPCSLWVLSILLALVIHSGSRRRIMLVGGTFLLVTATVYGLFIAGLFTMFAYVSFLGWIQILVALLALSFALINIKDYFWYKEGVSLTISDKHKPKIYKDIRSIMSGEKSTFALIATTVVMALGIALVELPCTAGFPVLWSNLVSTQGVTTSTFTMLLGLYILIYLGLELIIFITALVTLKPSKMEEKQGRVLKLVGGSVMLALAIVLIVDPDLMNNLGGTLLVFAAAFGGALLVLLLHRVVLPRFGIVIGTEFKTKKTKPRHRKVR